MFCRLFIKVLPAAFFLISVAQTYELSGKAERPLDNLMLQRDNHKLSKDGYMHLLESILQSDNFNSYASEIPCEIVQKLEHNGDEAKVFVEEIVSDDMPPIIKDLSDEIQRKIQHEFSDILRIVYKKVSETQLDSAAAITSALDSFNNTENGTSVPDIDKIPKKAISGFVSLLAGFTHGSITTHSTCLAADSSTSTKNHHTSVTVFTTTTSVVKQTSTRTASKQISTHKVTPPRVSASSYLPTSAVSNISRSSSPVPSFIPDPQTANLGTRTTSRPFESQSIGISAVAILGVLGTAVFL